MNKKEQEMYQRAITTGNKLQKENEELKEKIEKIKGFIEVCKSRTLLTKDENFIVEVLSNYLK